MATQVTTLDDLNGLMRAMMKTALERMLNTEMDVHLGRRTERAGTADSPTPNAPATNATENASAAPKNRRNGHSQKTVSGDMGDLQLRTPRDRNGTFEPQLIAKGQRRLDGFDEKVLALYAKGMTTRDIQDIVKDLYGWRCRRHSFRRSPPTSMPRSPRGAPVGSMGSGRSSISTASWCTCVGTTGGCPSTRCTSRSA